jgi:hypothetical protein
MVTRLFENTKDAIVTISSFPGSVSQNSVSSGWIVDIIDDRAIIITCAHSILQNKGLIPANTSETVVSVNTQISCTINNAIEKRTNKQKNICVSLGVLGMDIPSDIAVLFTYKPNETDSTVNLFGFLFSTQTIRLNFGQLPKNGTSIGMIDNLFNIGTSMNTGTYSDNNFILAPGNTNFNNYMPQFLAGMNVDVGSSGSPIIIADQNNTKPGLVVGIASYTKVTGGQYVGGSNVLTLKKSYNKIMKLNNKGIINLNNDSELFSYTPINFDGTTGAGYLGITSYFYVNDQTNRILLQNYPAFAPFASNVEGLVITNISTTSFIEGSTVYNAVEVNTGFVGIFVNDIVLKVNDVKVGLYESGNINFDAYYKASKPVILDILRPSTGEKLKFKVIPDIWPAANEFISTDDSLITLITSIDELASFVANGIIFSNVSNLEPVWNVIDFGTSYTENSNTKTLNYYFGVVIKSTDGTVNLISFYCSDGNGGFIGSKVTPTSIDNFSKNFLKFFNPNTNTYPPTLTSATNFEIQGFNVNKDNKLTNVYIIDKTNQNNFIVLTTYSVTTLTNNVTSVQIKDDLNLPVFGLQSPQFLWPNLTITPTVYDTSTTLNGKQTIPTTGINLNWNSLKFSSSNAEIGFSLIQNNTVFQIQKAGNLVITSFTYTVEVTFPVLANKITLSIIKNVDLSIYKNSSITSSGDYVFDQSYTSYPNGIPVQPGDIITFKMSSYLQPCYITKGQLYMQLQ